jgi:hypothetical protein
LGGIATPVGTRRKAAAPLAAQLDAFDLDAQNAHDAVYRPKTRAATTSFQSVHELDLHIEIYLVETRVTRINPPW